MTKTKKSLWPYAIIGVLVIFATFIVSIAVYISKKNVDLESKEYYAESVAYNDVIDMKNAFEKLLEKPTIAAQEGGKLSITFPLEYWNQVDSGALFFKKPDNASLDFETTFKKPIAPSISLQLGEKQKGSWKVRFQFSMEGTQYLSETDLTL